MSGTVLHGDSRQMLASLPDASVDSIVTDPPYELSQDGKASAARVAAEIMFPKKAHVPAKRSESDQLPFLLSKVAGLGSVGLVPAEPCPMPVGAVALDNETPGGHSNVAHSDVAPVGTAQGDASDDADAQITEHLGTFFLELADIEAGVDAINRSGSGFVSGGLGVGLAVSPAGLPGFARSGTSVVVADEVVGALDDALASLVGASTRAEELAVPHPFHLGGGTEDNITAFGALTFLSLCVVSGSKLVGADPAASRLSPVLQPHRVSVVHPATHRALTFDLLIHAPNFNGAGFMGKAWDGSKIAYDIALWRECLRVLKPGGHLLAFGGTRTYHRMAVAIEDAGFEVRDSIHWLYGSGFPKSLDVSKAIDKAARGFPQGSADPASPNHGRYKTQRTEGKRGDSDTGRGYGGGPGAFMAAAGESTATAPATDAAKQWAGFGTALKPAHEPVVVARKPLAGTVAANVLEHGTGALNIDGCRVGVTDADYARNCSGDRGHSGTRTSEQEGATDIHAGGGTASAAGRWPANLVFTHAADCGDECADGCPVAELDGQSGHLRPATSLTKRVDRSPFTTGSGKLEQDEVYNDTGGASRFFTVTEWDPTADIAPFRYVAKPSKRERNAGLDGLPEVVAGSFAGGNDTRNNGSTTRSLRQNHHPTVKPVALMRWLVRLVTPPGGTVLDPFLGSGTTAVAATLEGFGWIGCEMTEDYLPIIAGRVAWAEAEAAKAPQAPTLFDPEVQS